MDMCSMVGILSCARTCDSFSLLTRFLTNEGCGMNGGAFKLILFEVVGFWSER